MKNSDEFVVAASLRLVGHEAEVAGFAIEDLWASDMSFLEKVGLATWAVWIISTRQLTHDGDWKDGQIVSCEWLPPQETQR